jgi:cold shock CspA family protein
MRVPVQVSFRGIPISDEIEARCVKEAEKLERYAQRITSCRVVIAAPHHRQMSGNVYEIRVDVTLPGFEIIANRTPPAHRASENVDIALREAFDSARRQLEDAVRRQRGAVKMHSPPGHGRVARLVPEEAHGFLECPDGHEVYFHAHSVSGAKFEDLAVGTQVRFLEERGDDGPQATSVTPVGRHGHLSP